VFALKQPAHPEDARPRRTEAGVRFIPGHNVWRVDRAERFRCVQDGAEYFRLAREAMLAARRSIFLLGWDIAATTDLLPGETPGDAPTRFDELLAFIIRRRPELQCYILIWDYASLYSLERDPLSRLRLGWRMPRRVHFGFDDRHPIGGSHHQKVLVIDDRLAFSGSLDITSHRWDTSAHRPEERHRTTLTGAPYSPYHEVQALVEGPVAARLGELARDRWRVLGARRLPPVAATDDVIWPEGVEPDVKNVDVAISRTVPGTADEPAIRECEALFFDSIGAARHSIFIENQYFTSPRIADALAARLEEPDGPEIIVVNPKDCHGWLETNTMCAFRDTVFRQLERADRHGRLRLVYPIVSRIQDVSTFIHSKVMIVDDDFLRIGSANCSNRSLGVDTECDLTIAAHGDPRIREGIVRMRDRLLAEHLGQDAAEVGRELKHTGSIAGLIDRNAMRDRCLERLTIGAETAVPSETLRPAADPEEPPAFGPAVERLLPAIEMVANQGPTPLRLWILPGVAILAAAVVAWAADPPAALDLQSVQRALEGIPTTPRAALTGGALFVLGAAFLIPVELLLIVSGLLFGFQAGVWAGLVASLASAVAGYAAGRLLGPARLRDWMSLPAYRSGRQLVARSPVAVAMLHFAGFVPAWSAHLICGASRISLGHYLPGAVAGLVPAVVALTGLGALLRETVFHPTIESGLLSMGAAALLIAVTAALRTFLLVRRFAPGLSLHRRRAEFG
jgi:phospholipase D1/2